MPISLPIAVGKNLIGTSFVGGSKDKKYAFVTTLHQIGTESDDIFIGIPQHGGNINQVQQYPVVQVPTISANLELIEPFLDIAILTATVSDANIPEPRFISHISEVSIGTEVLIVGYPYAVIGSVLETVETSTISALGRRSIFPDVSRNEIVLSHFTLPGSSGSPIVRKSDGKICGVLRGCLAPPSMISVGGLPIGTESNVTYATSAEYIKGLIDKVLYEGR